MVSGTLKEEKKKKRKEEEDKEKNKNRKKRKRKRGDQRSGGKTACYLVPSCKVTNMNNELMTNYRIINVDSYWQALMTDFPTGNASSGSMRDIQLPQYIFFTLLKWGPQCVTLPGLNPI